MLPSDLVLWRRPDVVGPRPHPGGVDGLHPVDVANARRHVGAGETVAVLLVCGFTVTLALRRGAEAKTW